MSKKDYEILAAALKSAYPKESEYYDMRALISAIHAWDTASDEIAGALRKTNPRFNVARFVDAATPPTP